MHECACVCMVAQVQAHMCVRMLCLCEYVFIKDAVHGLCACVWKGAVSVYVCSGYVYMSVHVHISAQVHAHMCV